MTRRALRPLAIAVLLLGVWACDGNRTAGTDATSPMSDTADAPESSEGCDRTFVYRHEGQPAPFAVKVTGSIPGDDLGVAMTDQGGGFYHGVVPDLPPGTYRYRFEVDGVQLRDPDNPLTPDSGQSVAEHTCPFTPACLTDDPCAPPTPVCRYYECVAGGPPPAGCVSDEDCPGRDRCWDGECGPECRDDDDCEGDLTCADGLCEPDNAPECMNDDDCAGRCWDGVCGPECRDHEDCDLSERCLAGTCAAPECVVDTDCPNLIKTACDDGVCARRPCDARGFVFQAPEDIETLHVAGSWNGWASTVADGGVPMTPIGDPSERRWYGVATGLPEGRHEYKLVGTEDDTTVWWHDDGNPLLTEDGHGGSNSVFHVECVGRCGDPDVFDWRDGILYFVLVDRFFDSDDTAHPVDGATGLRLLGASGQFEGGDLQGVTEKLPYIADLGVNSLWLSAPYKNRDEAGASIHPDADPNVYSAYHGYWPSPANIDYTDPQNPVPAPAVEWRIAATDDPAAELKALVDTAHDRGMKVLLDYVMNHVDRNSGLYEANPSWFAETRLCGPEDLWEDEYWGTRCAFTDYLPSFAFEENPAARAWSVSDALWWAREFDIDGFRLDAIKHVPTSWLIELRAALNQAFTSPRGGRFYLVGETFSYFDKDLLASFIDPPTMLDGQFDFPAKRHICEAALLTGEGRADMHDFAHEMLANDTYYGPDAIMTTWIGNHDVPRPIHWATGQLTNCSEGSTAANSWTTDFPQPAAPEPYERLAVAFAVLMTGPGVPLIYYGDEIGLAGGGDPDNRRMMPWSDLNSHQVALRDRVSELAHIRQQNKVLSRGRREMVAVHSLAGWWVFRMTGCGGDTPDVIVALNRNDEARTMPIPPGRYTDLRKGTTVHGGDHTVPPRDYRILREAF